MSGINIIGQTDWRNQQKQFGIKEADRFAHIYVIGKSGTGKSSLLQNMAISDIQNSNGVAVIDPHSDTVETLLHYIPKERVDDIIYFNPSDNEYAIAFNPLDGATKENAHLVLAGLISTFKKIWSDSWGPRLEYILRYAIATLLCMPESTLLDIQPLLTDYDFRKKALAYCEDAHIRQFWYQEYDKYTPSLRAEAISSILNKTGVFTALKPLRNILGQPKSSFQIQEVMDSGKILLCNLGKGTIGEDACRILGCFLINAIQIAALTRAGQLPENRRPFFLYVDEMGIFVNEVFCELLSEARKFKLGIFMAHQFIGQLPEHIREAVFGNAGTQIVFRIGAQDADYLAKEFYPVFREDDFMNLPIYNIYIKLQVDGATSKPFSAKTLPLPSQSISYKEIIKSASRKSYGNQLFKVEREITERYKSIVRPKITLFGEG